MGQLCVHCCRAVRWAPRKWLAWSFFGVEFFELEFVGMEFVEMESQLAGEWLAGETKPTSCGRHSQTQVKQVKGYKQNQKRLDINQQLTPIESERVTNNNKQEVTHTQCSNYFVCCLATARWIDREESGHCCCCCCYSTTVVAVRRRLYCCCWITGVAFNNINYLISAHNVDRVALCRTVVALSCASPSYVTVGRCSVTSPRALCVAQSRWHQQSTDSVTNIQQASICAPPTQALH